MRRMTWAVSSGIAAGLLNPRTRLSSPSFPSRTTMTTAAPNRDPRSNPKVSTAQSILGQSSQGGWEKCWEEGVTPWDLGRPTPVILHLVQTGSLPTGRALVPGCGGGHDVVAMACPERYVVGLDISQTAVKQTLERTSELPNKEFFTFEEADFFNWQPAELFDLIFDYTFFCAIDPSMRSKWATQIGNLLKPNGELITLIYPVDQYDGGPPFAVSPNEYEKVLAPLGFKAISLEDNEFAIGPRKGKEKLGRWKRNSAQALM